MKLQTFVLTFLTATSAYAGPYVTVLTGKAGEKSVIMSSALSDPAQHVVSAWTIIESDEFKPDWDKIDASDEAYITSISDTLSSDSNTQLVLVDKSNGNILFRAFDTRPCIITGVGGANFGCARFSDQVVEARDLSAISYVVNGRFTTNLVVALKLRKWADGLAVDATASQLLPLLNNSLMGVLDAEHGSESQYLENREALGHSYVVKSIASSSKGIRMVVDTTSEVPKGSETPSFTKSMSFILQSPKGKGELTYKR